MKETKYTIRNDNTGKETTYKVRGVVLSNDILSSVSFVFAGNEHRRTCGEVNEVNHVFVDEITVNRYAHVHLFAFSTVLTLNLNFLEDVSCRKRSFDKLFQ